MFVDVRFTVRVILNCDLIPFSVILLLVISRLLIFIYLIFMPLEIW